MSNLVEKLELKEGMTFKNYNELCNFMNWKNTGGDYKKARIKELSTMCKWHNKGYKFVIEEVYKEQLQKIDKRSKNNIFINSIEIILLFSLRNIDAEKYNLYFSNSKFYKLLGLFNNNFENLNYSDIDLVLEELQIDYSTFKSFKVNSKAEANKIIARALKSLHSRKVIDYYEGMIIVDNNNVSRLASYEESRTITRLQKEVFNELHCFNFSQIEFRNLQLVYYRKLNKKIKESNIEKFQYFYRGYCVTSHNKSIAEEIERQCKDENFKKLNDLFIEKMQRVAENRHKYAIKKEKEKLLFGECMLLDEASKSYISDSNKLINNYIKH